MADQVDPELWILVHGGEEGCLHEPVIPSDVIDILIGRFLPDRMFDKDYEYLEGLVPGMRCPELQERLLSEGLKTPDAILLLEALAMNEQADPTVLATLAQNEDRFVRKHTAANQATPGSVLSALARDPHPSVRLSVAANPSTPKVTLRVLAELETDVQVKTTAQARLGRLKLP